MLTFELQREIHGPETAVLDALSDKVPARRALAGCIVGRIGNAEQKKIAAKLLDDEETIVRLRTAQGLLASHEKTGIPTLIELLDRKPVTVAWQAEELLVWVTGPAAPNEVVWAGGASAAQAKEAWSKWWRDNANTVDLNKVAKEPRRPLLFSDVDTFYLVGGNGCMRWQQLNVKDRETIRHAVLLPNDRVVGMQTLASDDGIEYLYKSAITETTLDGRLVRQTVLKSNNRADRCIFTPNGIATIGSDDGLQALSIGLEGQTKADIRTESIGRKNKIGCLKTVCDGLTVVLLVDFFDELDVVLFDPLSGKILCRSPLRERHWTVASSNGKILRWDSKAVWILEVGEEPVCIHKLKIEEQILNPAIGAFRKNRLATSGHENTHQIRIHSYFPAWKTLATVPLDVRCGFSGGIRMPMPLVTFGFP